MLTYLVDVLPENINPFDLLCRKMEWTWDDLQNDKAKIVRIKDTPPVLNLFEKLNGSIYIIKKKNK